MSIGGETTSRKVRPGPSQEPLEIGCQGDCRPRAWKRVSGNALAIIEMDAHVLADLHRDAGAGIDAIQARLSAAPDTEAGREILVDWPRDREGAVDEQVAALEADDAALKIGIEVELPGQRTLVDPGLGEDGEGIAAAELADALAPLGG